MDLSTLYNNDRRKQNAPVLSDRRSGIDRRTLPRVDEYLNKDIHRFDWVKTYKLEEKKKNSIILAFLSTIPYARRFLGIQDAHIAHTTAKETGKALIMLVNVKEDWRDMKNASLQFIGKIKISPEDAAFQSEFSFFRGTCLEILLKKLGNLGKKISKLDKTLYKTKTGMKFLKLIGWKMDEVRKTKRKNIFGEFAREIKIEGSLASRIIGRAMLRIPVIGMIVLFSLEIPSVYKAFDGKNNIKNNIKEGFKQIAKSFVSVSSMITGAGILGAILASKKGHIGSLIGIGLGTYYGTEAANKINKQIDKI